MINSAGTSSVVCGLRRSVFLRSAQQSDFLLKVFPPPNPGTEFEVASIRRNNEGNGVVNFRTTPNGISYTNVTLFKLIAEAYGLEDFQIRGGPSWVKSDRFDVIARTAPDGVISPTQRNTMIRNLLVARFKLQFEFESTEMPVYLLTMRRPGVLGPQLSVSDVDCTLSDTPIAVRRDRARCHIEYGFETLVARGRPLNLIITSLQSEPEIERVIVDRTGLTGPFNFSLHYNVGGKRDSVAPSVFTALEQQLGLTLQSGKGPVEMFTLASAEQPTND